MCTGQPPATVAEALAGLRASLAFLNQVPAAGLPGVVQADCLRELAMAESAYTAAHAAMLGAFAASGAHEDDGQRSGRAWLKWQTQVTTGAAVRRCISSASAARSGSTAPPAAAASRI